MTSRAKKSPAKSTATSKKSNKKSAKSKPFSLVPSDAQREMYRAIEAVLQGSTEPSNTAVAEIAATAALGEKSIVIVSEQSSAAEFIQSRHTRATERTETAALPSAPGFAVFTPSSSTSAVNALTAATFAAFARLATSPSSRLALISCGHLDSENGIRDGELRETLQVAARMKLPIIYVVDTDLAASKPKNDLRTVYAEFGVPVITVDHSDAIAIFRVTTEAMHNARVGRGPTLIEATTLPSVKGQAPHGPLEALESYMRRHQTWFE